MKKSNITKMISVFLAAVITLCFCSCQSKRSYKQANLDMNLSGRTVSLDFVALPADVLLFSDESAKAVNDVIENQKADFEYEHLYELDEVKKRLDFDAAVDTHRYNALNEVGVLEASHLSKIVMENNEAFLEEHDFGYEAVDEEYATQLCSVIVTTVNMMKDKYPEIDWSRVYCNLGNLKILYDVGMLSYAQVSKDLVLSVSKNNTEIVLTMKGDNSFRNVLIHETMHIIQIGCKCEKIENCERRCGISVHWEDFTLNTTDWGWFFEGSAERNMCNLTGEEAISYQYKMDYICSFTMSVLLKENVNADTMETMSFFDDPQLLFDAFGAESQKERDEVLKLMITTNILQMQPQIFFDNLKADTGIDYQKDNETLDNFSYSLKPAICITLAKEFYSNLCSFLTENEISSNDLFFLINLFEGHLNQHLNYNNESKAQINKPFTESYLIMRNALFDALKRDNPSVDIQSLYEEYSILSSEAKLNAELSMLPVDKITFLAERAQWQQELNALGIKVTNN